MKILLLLVFTFCISGCLFSQKPDVLCEVFFQTNSSTLSAEEYLKLESLIKNADTVQISGVSISAYCDDVGSSVYNENLSGRRAGQIKKILMSLAVPGKLIDTKGNGEIALKDSNTIEQARANNRMALVTITYAIKQKEKGKEKTAEKPEEQPKQTQQKYWGPIKSPLTDDQKVGDVITLENIYFFGGRHAILPQSYDDLEALAKTLLEKKKYHVMILGHICCVQSGNDAMDFDTGIANLSEARAKMIYNYLVKRGVSPHRLQYKGLKNDFPTGISNMRDKRVEIEITKIVSE